MASIESFYDKSKRLETEVYKHDNKISKLIQNHSNEIHTKESQIKILEQQLKNTHKSLKEVTLLYNNSESKVKKLIKKIDSLGLFARS